MTKTDKGIGREGAALTRRVFLGSSGGVAALAAAPAEAGTDAAEENTSNPRDVALKDTDHIRTYYALARR